MVAQCSDYPAATISAKVFASATGYVKAINSREGLFLGASLALSADGRWLAVGAPSENNTATGLNGNPHAIDASTVDGTPTISGELRGAGAVYVYHRDADGRWAHHAYVKAPTAVAGMFWGRAVALSADGSVLVVGADGAATGRGEAHVLTRTDDAWAYAARLAPAALDEGDRFGGAVAVSSDGQVVAVGAIGDDSIAIGVNGDRMNNDAESRCVVGLDGGGNPIERPCAGSAGAVYVFQRLDEAWVDAAFIKASNTRAFPVAQASPIARFGASVALSADGRRLAVGAPGEGNQHGGIDADAAGPYDVYDAGAAYVYTQAGDAWAATAYIKDLAPTAGAHFGQSVQLSGDGQRLAVLTELATFDNGEAPAISVFEANEAGWAAPLRLRPEGLAAGAPATSLAMSADGAWLALGVRVESRAGVGIGEPSQATALGAGATFVFAKREAGWARAAYVKASNTEEGDGFGAAVALDGNGETLVVSAPYEDSAHEGVGLGQTDNSRESAGAAYIY